LIAAVKTDTEPTKLFFENEKGEKFDNPS